ncbi:unnamed protein product [Aphanomyces euteiches]|uniref:AMP-dependent synthetase/ligase domain-containing protein n=1 Tax=Aphanomyces euteiches TaxID=100861 RepID=A0A6G0WTJ8_9STRA|nr:hypothetical protein Ae201684_011898 [Aphanomyces euteiches]KAH9089337.1 hypothetical protein Ae201684P_001537 [Aphanomyces euteiches]KAH9153621.1 hypothetical protein AeRB84_004159 [Aphanomyces euteiches]
MRRCYLLPQPQPQKIHPYTPAQTPRFLVGLPPLTYAQKPCVESISDWLVQDTGASIVLTNSKYRNLIKLGAVKAFLKKPKRTIAWPAHIAWLKTDKLKIALKSTKAATTTQPSDVAFIQYTSGSTEEPRPAMVTHANIHAQGLLWDWCASDDLVLGWLPPYHDNGLLAFNLMPIYCGNKSVQMSPLAFIKDPSIWMRMASKYKAGYTCGPNFAYLLAAKRTADNVAATLDLTKLRNAACGAEPIKPDYLALFASKFAAAGFVPSQFNCALGMAEATLVVTGYPDPATRGGPKALTVDRTILEKDHPFEILDDLKDDGKAIHLTGLGYFGRTYDLKIVDPTTRRVLPDGRVGEIWIHGPSMVQNYWNRPELSQARLQATIPSEREPSKGYFRTNDYGVLVDGELFFVGRIPDMIAMDGRWISPQTIESSVERATDCIRPGCVSCFTLPRHDNDEGRESVFDEDEDPALVVVAELKQDMNTATNGQAIVATLCKSILRQIWSENHVQATTIVLLQPKSIPKTTSGKLQRWRAKQMFFDKQLKVQCAYSHTVRSVNKKNAATLKDIENALATKRFTPILLLDPASPMPSPIVQSI